MTEEKRFYVLGKVYHQEDSTNPTELLGDAENEFAASDLISRIMNDSFSPKDIFVIEGVKKKISIKGVKIE